MVSRQEVPPFLHQHYVNDAGELASLTMLVLCQG